jgi:RNA recognition motif-containing protein
MMPGTQMGMNPMMNFGQPQMPMGMPMGQPTSQGVSLYVGNLSPSISEEILMQMFSKFGSLSNVRIMKDSFTKKSREFGFVTFFNKEEAMEAQKEMNNTQHFGRELRVYVKKNVKNLPKDANVVIRNLNKNITSRALTEHCSEFGEIVSCYVKTQMVNNVSESCGYGYVQYNNSEAAKKCIAAMNGSEISGQEVVAEVFIPSSQRTRPGLCNMYIKDFPEDWKQPKIEAWLEEKFSEYGKIQSKAVFIDKNHYKFYAFVALDTPEAAKKAQEEVNGMEVGEGDVKGSLYVNIAIPRKHRMQMLQSQREKQKNETNLYMRSLKVEVSEEQLKEVFGKYGEITSTCLREWTGHVGSGIFFFGFCDYCFFFVLLIL